MRASKSKRESLYMLVLQFYRQPVPAVPITLPTGICSQLSLHCESISYHFQAMQKSEISTRFVVFGEEKLVLALHSCKSAFFFLPLEKDHTLSDHFQRTKLVYVKSPSPALYFCIYNCRMKFQVFASPSNLRLLCFQYSSWPLISLLP